MKTRAPQALLVTALAASAQVPLDKPVSFEDGVPTYVQAGSSEISTSDRYSQHGAQSLRWDWKRGDHLTFVTGPLGNIGVWTGYGGYSRSAFRIAIYNETPGDGALTFRWMAGDQVGATFSFPLHVQGWQTICYHYSWESHLADRRQATLEKTDRIVVATPDAGGGTVYFDAVDFNKPLDFRMKRHPITETWAPVDPSTAEGVSPEMLAPATPEELDALAYLEGLDRTRFPRSAPPTGKEADDLTAQITGKYHLRRLDDGHVVGHLTGTINVPAIGQELGSIATAWLHAPNPALKQRFEDLYLALDDFFRIQGATAQGSIRGINNYVGRYYANAAYIMRDPLRRHRRLGTVRNCLKFNYNFHQVFESGRAVRSMDYFYNDARYLVAIALMHDTPQERVVHVRAFAKRFDRQILDTIKPDGSLYHHGAHYFAYAGGGLNSMADLIKLLSDTPFRPGIDAYNQAKMALMNMRYYANVTDLPMSLHGRHPGRQRLRPPTFLTLARAGGAYSGGKLDADVAAAYLRLVPDEAGSAEFADAGIAPELPPNGNVAMNYAGLMGHRRSDWLALVRGYGKYYWAQESYGNANRHGLFFGNGYLDILASGDPINILDSGCVVAEGWDWRYLDGTTAIHMPYKKMANGNGTMAERSGVGFIGGLSHRGTNGVFVMPLRSSMQYRKALPDGDKGVESELFTANKTFFFFDDRIVCLGSGISLPRSPYPVHTTLFQKHLPNQAPEGATPTYPAISVNGRKVAAIPFAELLPNDKQICLIDTQHTGYFLPPGQQVHIERKHQTSRDGHDKHDTEGEYATAWIDHGTNPTDASYEYAVLVRTTPERLAEFAEAAGVADSAPYTVYQRDASAHIVRDRGTRVLGAVFFEPQTVALAKFAVRSIDHPCLVMQEDKDDNRIALSISDPDLNLVDGLSQARELKVTLVGRWRAVGPPSSIRVDSADETTTLCVTTENGATYSLDLERSH